jgi:hypothetical protein
VPSTSTSLLGKFDSRRILHTFEMTFRTSSSVYSLAIALLLALSTPTKVVAGGGRPTYVFDKDRAGNERCNEAKDLQEDPETFRLYCVNRADSFKHCAVTCSGALSFEGSKGKCKDYECNFYDYTFQTQDNQPLNMFKMARNKATLFAVVPLWESQAQYFYELLEEVRKDYKQETEAFLLPMDVDPEDVVTIEAFHTQRVHILNNTSPGTISRHPFLGFLQTLRYSSGFREFNVFTDRPVVFMISPDGQSVERLVVPTYKEIQETLKGFGVEKQGEDVL